MQFACILVLFEFWPVTFDSILIIKTQLPFNRCWMNISLL